jgi:hypothetical protein
MEGLLKALASAGGSGRFEGSTDGVGRFDTFLVSNANVARWR